MRTDLLNDLANALEELGKTDWKAAGFNMYKWASSIPESPELGCGTECCAYGLGTTLPSWKEAGLSLKLSDALSPFYTYIPTDRAIEILGLSSNAWNRVFSPACYYESSGLDINPLKVAKRIRELTS